MLWSCEDGHKYGRHEDRFYEPHCTQSPVTISLIQASSEPTSGLPANILTPSKSVAARFRMENP